MKLDLGSVTFNMNITEGGGTPSWGTALGQNANYNYSVPGIEELLTSMVYCVIDTKDVFCPLGRGGQQQDNSHYELASLYKKIYANGKYIPDAQFVLLIVKQINGEHHVGRRTLKYNSKITYKDESLNNDCYEKIALTLGISESGSWFIHSIHTENQDELHFEVIIADKDNTLEFQNSEERKKYIFELLKEEGIESTLSPSDRKNRYKNWLTNLGDLAEATINNYVRYIDYIKENHLTEYDLYSVNDISILTDLIDKFKSDQQYIDYNNQNNRNPYNALLKYIEFMNSEIVLDSADREKNAYNMIYYGTPGCGKSYLVNKDFNEQEYIVYRTTFHPEYSNSDFVGQIIPKTEGDEIKYKFQEGPFSIALLNAIKNPSKKVCLIIEEINRGNASAIFGDIFQLLDRDSNGTSIYSIVNEPIKKYLQESGINAEKITIPSNLWIIATMNTSDQNVFTLDTAFKRRWRMHRIVNKFKNEEYDRKLAKMYIPGSSYTWEQFVTEINKEIMIKNPTGLNSEDKQLGVYFVTENELSFEPINNSKDVINKFVEKVLLYIWDDVAKIDSDLWFGEDIKSFDDLVSEYYKNNLKVFKDMFRDQANNESQVREENEENI